MAGRPKKVKKRPHSGLFSRENQPKKLETESAPDKSLLSADNIVESKRRGTTVSDDDTFDKENFTFFTEYLKMVLRVTQDFYHRELARIGKS